MKKNYIKPALKVAEIKFEPMMTESIPSDDEIMVDPAHALGKEDDIYYFGW